jgi:outer membrane protein
VSFHEASGPRAGTLFLSVTAAFLLAIPASGQAADTAVLRSGAPLTMADVVALALQNNPQTRVSYAQARAATAAYASARGRLFPTVNLTAPVSRTHGVSGGAGGTDSTGVRAGGGTDRTAWTPGVSMSYLLLDFGGRGGTIQAARETAAAAAELSDVTVQTTILQAQAAFFGYNAARDVMDAEQANRRMAQEARDAAVSRYRVGLATVADTLQATTAVAQAEVARITAVGGVQVARGNLAAAMGTSADVPFQVARTSGPVPVQGVGATVDTLMARAVRERPDLAAARSQAAAAEAQIRVARAATLPSLSVNGNAGHTLSTQQNASGNTYGVSLGVAVPVFSGGARQADVRSARALAEAAQARVDVAAVQVANQVFTAYSALQVAAARVRAAELLLATAVQSEAVARGRYSEGVGSFLDLLTAQNALAAARAQAAQSRWQWQSALAQLAHDVGTLDRTGAPGLPLTDSAPTTVPEVTR